MINFALKAQWEASQTRYRQAVRIPICEDKSGNLRHGVDLLNAWLKKNNMPVRIMAQFMRYETELGLGIEYRK